MAPSRAGMKYVGRSRRLIISTHPRTSPQKHSWSSTSSKSFLTPPKSAAFSTSPHPPSEQPISPKPLPNTRPPTKSAHSTFMDLAASLQSNSSNPRQPDPNFVPTSSRPPGRSRNSLVASALADTNPSHIASLLRISHRQRYLRGAPYAPHDLSPIEATKNRNATNHRPPKDALAPTRSEFKDSTGRQRMDVFDQLGINPLNEYRNVAIMQEFMGPTGRIKHPRETGLRKVNQRKVAKAIRRAVGMGLIGSVHRHPMVLEAEKREEEERDFERGYRDRGMGRRRGY